MKNYWLQHLNANPIPWLLASNPWTKYQTIIDLQEESPTSGIAKATREELLQHRNITQLQDEAANWIEKAPKRNSDPDISYFKLRMLSDFGLKVTDAGIGQIATKAAAHTEGPFHAVRGELPKRLEEGEQPHEADLYTDEWHALPCNSPIITYTLLKLGVPYEEVQDSVSALAEKWDSRLGWFCHFFFVESQYKKLQIGCPMAGIMAMEVFSQVQSLKESQYARNAYETVRFHKEYGKSIYYFGRSKKFFTLKYPFVWYNALYLADVVTRFDFCKSDELVRQLVDWVVTMQDSEGKFKPTSMFLKYKGWDFADKKQPSPWITYLCCRILKRYYG